MTAIAIQITSTAGNPGGLLPAATAIAVSGMPNTMEAIASGSGE